MDKRDLANWRPQNWMEIVRFNVSTEIYSKREVKLLREFMDIGAAEVLKALRRNGSYTEGLAPTLSIDISPGQKGRLVFIPDTSSVDGDE